jgi:hypothetical protein
MKNKVDNKNETCPYATPGCSEEAEKDYEKYYAQELAEFEAFCQQGEPPEAYKLNGYFDRSKLPPGKKVVWMDAPGGNYHDGMLGNPRHVERVVDA